ncbi:MAG: YolD-like family protein [Lachnospiraceae bacterium]|nr:YolD-like family protein [Lachnospiraceae bacterium]
MASRPKHKMPIEDRAKQFMPFAALKGLPDALAAKEKITVPKVELSEEMAEELDRKMHMLTKGIITSVVYFHRDEYIKITGMVARIDETGRLLQIVNTKIPFDDILKITFPSETADPLL